MLGKPDLKPDLERGADRVSSGGFWSSVPKVARVADRVSDNPNDRDFYFGFRLVRNTNHEGERDEKEG